MYEKNEEVVTVGGTGCAERTIRRFCRFKSLEATSTVRIVSK
jgi:hypothetical protein